MAGFQRLGQEQVGLVIDAGEAGPRLSDFPAVEIAAPLEYQQDRVELAYEIVLAQELGEGRAHKCVGRLTTVPADEVDGQVVGGPERGRQRPRAASRDAGHVGEAVERGAQDRRVADLVDATPTRPPRELGVLAWGELRCPRPPNLVTSSITTDLAGMLMPRASVSVAKTTFTSASAKHASTASRNGGTMPA